MGSDNHLFTKAIWRNCDKIDVFCDKHCDENGSPLEESILQWLE